MTVIPISLTSTSNVSAISITAILRSDNGLPPSGFTSPLALTDTGLTFTGSFTDDFPPPAYAVQGTLTLTNGATGALSYTLAVTSGATAIGFYTTQTLMQAKYGTTNIILWSNKGNANTYADVASVQLAITTGESQLNMFWASGPYNVPLSPVNATISDWATTISAYWLYTNRGMFEDDALGNKLKQQYSEAMNQMALYKGNTSMLTLPCGRRWPSPTAAAVVGRRR